MVRPRQRRATANLKGQDTGHEWPTLHLDATGKPQPIATITFMGQYFTARKHGTPLVTAVIRQTNKRSNGRTDRQTNKQTDIAVA